MVLETTFATAAGSVTLVDALALGANERGHDLGRNAPSLLIRQVVGVTGQVELEMEYVPRTEYGLIWPLLGYVDGGIAGRGGPDLTVLSAPVDLQIRAGAVVGRFSVAAGERVAFGLHYGQLRRAGTAGVAAGRTGQAAGGHSGWVAVLVGDPPELCGPVARACPRQRPGAAGPDVLPDGRDCGGTDDLAAGSSRRCPQLGLSLLLGARRLADDGRAVGGGLPG